MEIPKWLSKKDQQMAQQFGGADAEDYTTPDQLTYCDKGQHLLSSLFHQPQHADHWKKEAKKEKYGRTGAV